MPRKAFAAKAKKTEWRIFLDMDGVISDFDTHAKDNGVLDEKGQPKWDLLSLDWWSTMPAFKGARKFYDALKDFAPVRFLTAPILSKDCFTGKAMWIQKFLPNPGGFAYGLLSLIICPAKDKHFLARPNHILVDDREKNIKEWETAGGVGVHHKGDYAETLAKVADIMSRPPAAPKPHAAEEPRLFVNISAVLADFVGHANAHDKFDAKGKPKWDELDANWWKTMPAFEGASEFYEELRKLGAPRFLTSPAPTTDGFTGKPEWVLNFLPARGKWSLLDIIVCRGKDKELMAAPANILIDDNAANVAAWVKSGGIGILHTGDFKATLEKVKEAMAGLKPATPAAPKGPAAP